MPDPDYVIQGTIYETIVKGRSEIRVTIEGAGGKAGQNLYIGGNTSTAKGLPLTVYNATKDKNFNNPVSITTSITTGKYLLSCNKFSSGWSVNDIIRIIASNVEDTYQDLAEDDQTDPIRIGSRRRILTDKDGNEIGFDNPLPVYISSDNIFDMNGDIDYTHDVSGRMTSETKTINGISYTRTYTYTGNNFYADRISKWTKN